MSNFRMNSRAIIFLNGDKSDSLGVEKYIDDKTLLIGCDAGAQKIFELGRKPDVIIGDFDSLNQAPAKDIKTIKHPTDKDYTDSHAAINYALEKGVKEIILTGFLGTRTDHLLGNIFLLNRPEFSAANLKIVEGNQEIYIITGQVEIKGNPGDVISFIPIFKDVQAKFSSGLKYDLAKYTLSMKGNTGISNEFIETSASVNINNDTLLVVQETNAKGGNKLL